MAIGTLAAIGLGLAGAGSIIGASSSNKAAKTAAQTAQQTTDSNNALAAYVYGQNQETLDPYVQRGNAAGNQMNALLGLGGATEPASPAQAGQPANALAQTGWGMPAQGVNALYGASGFPLTGYEDQYYAQLHGEVPSAFWLDPNRDPQAGFGQDMVTTANGGQPSAPVNPQQAATSAYDIFKNSTGYQSRLNEGMNALNSGWAGAGTLQSGAAMKAALRYGQDFASNEFGNYMGYLGNQQGVGLSGASALAGVGQNYANSVMTNNNNAGTAAMNSALYRGANNPFANTLGMIGGGLWGMAK